MNPGVMIAALLGGLFFWRKAPSKGAKLSKNFKVSEFLKSSTFPNLRNYELTPAEYENLSALVVGILQPVRDKFGKVVITGGGRPHSVAAAKGTTWHRALGARGLRPAKDSDHADFSAADIDVPGARLDDVYEFIKTLPATRQVILEYTRNKSGAPVMTHIHVAAQTTSKGRHRSFAFRDVPREAKA